MLISLALNNVPTPPESNKDPLSGFTNIVATRAVLTKAMWLLLMVDCLAVLAFAVYWFVPPELKQSIGLTRADIRLAFWVGFVMNIGLVSAFVFSEIIINFVHGRGFKEKD